jgi:quinol monooxygenase YgiN
MHFIVKRNVKDYDTWKKVVSDLDGLRKEYGSKGVTVYRSASDPNEVYLIFNWDDEKPYMNYINLPGVQESIAETGTTEVIEVSETFYLAE